MSLTGINMFAPTPPPPKPMWLHMNDVYIAAVVSYKGKTVDVLGTITKEEYFRLKLAGNLDADLHNRYAEHIADGIISA